MWVHFGCVSHGEQSVDGGRKWNAVLGRPRFGWMNGVVSEGNRDGGGRYAEDRKELT